MFTASRLIGEMILQRLKNWCLLCLLSISFLGCAKVIDFERGNKFETRVRSFSQAIRWSKFERAHAYIRMRKNHSQNHDFDQLNNIKVTKYQTTNRTPEENYDQQTSDIILVYEVDYFDKGSYKVQHLRYEQLWWYDETDNTWFLDSDLPKFKL